MHLNDDQRNALRRKGNHLHWVDLPKDRGSYSRLMAAHRLTHDFAARVRMPSKAPRSKEYAITRLQAYGFDAWGIASAITRWDTIELITELDDHHHNKESFRMAIPWLAGLAPWERDNKTPRKLIFADVPLLAAPPAVDQPPPGGPYDPPPINRPVDPPQPGNTNVNGTQVRDEQGWLGSETPHFVFDAPAQQGTPSGRPCDRCQQPGQDGQPHICGEGTQIRVELGPLGMPPAERKGRLHTRETTDEKLTVPVTFVFPGGAHVRIEGLITTNGPIPRPGFTVMLPNYCAFPGTTFEGDTHHGLDAVKRGGFGRRQP